MATAYWLARRYGVPATQDRYVGVDGLRGYLAYFVFLHHAAIWFVYRSSGDWKAPPSHLYTHFGQSSVAVFFMITGFLFFSKIHDGKAKPIDWGRLYVSRITRLTPLYLFAMLIMFLVVGFLSNWTLNESVQVLVRGVVEWLSFTVLGAPDLNAVPNTSLIVAGVTWSLPYEWFFYLLLPLLALASGVRPPLPYLVLSLVAAAIIFSRYQWEVYDGMYFLSGMLAAISVRGASFRRFAAGPLASVCIAVALFVLVSSTPNTFELLPWALLSVAFVLIAGGNTLWGVLRWPASRLLGEVSYSIYLLHGIILFVTFEIIFGGASGPPFSPLSHWLVIAFLSPLLVAGAFMTFRVIERPAMMQTQSVTAWLRQLPCRAKREVRR